MRSLTNPERENRIFCRFCSWVPFNLLFQSLFLRIESDLFCVIWVFFYFQKFLNGLWRFRFSTTGFSLQFLALFFWIRTEKLKRRTPNDFTNWVVFEMVRLDLDDFRTILETAGVDVWTFIDTAMEVASLDYGNQLKNRRDGIVERLYALTSPPSPRCRNCDVDGRGIKQSSGEVKEGSPSTPPVVGVEGEDDGDDPHEDLVDDEQKKVLEIKEQLEIPHQPEDALVELLQNLADMDITFQALKETDIGRHVNRLRKHSSNDVRRLVKHLVRKWKEIVDEWVRLNQPGEQTATLIGYGDSPQQKAPQNGYHQVPDFAYSPNPHNGSSGSDRNNSEPEPKGKPMPRRDAPPKPAQPASTSSITPQNRQKEQQKEANFNSQKLASATKRLQESYKEAENAKRQRTIQVMDIHEIPKPKNTFFSKNKGGGGGSQGRHW